MTELLEAQRTDPAAVPDSTRLRLNAGVLDRQYPEDVLPGHAAWLDWPWKLHRVENEVGETEHEIYNLEDDPDEENDLRAGQAARVELMNNELVTWQHSVVRSLNGDDYT